MRRVLDREPKDLLRAPFDPRHWRALRGLLTVVSPGGTALLRYVTQRGVYPWTATLRTPVGRVAVTLHSRHDLLTVNEIYCRGDYGTAGPALVMDVGANIGLAALFWLTRRADSRVWCYEPNPTNVARLKETLRGYEDRYVLVEAAVSTEAGTASFWTEATGRYGHLADDGEGDLQVRVLELNAEVARAERTEGRSVELIKLDTEGSEFALVASLPPSPTIVIYEDSAGHVRTR